MRDQCLGTGATTTAAPAHIGARTAKPVVFAVEELFTSLTSFREAYCGTGIVRDSAFSRKARKTALPQRRGEAEGAENCFGSLHLLFLLRF
jgi:hypothetical protein